MRRLATWILVLILLLALPTPAGAAPAGPMTGFLYQGTLRNNGAPVNATCSFKFTLYDALTAGNQISVPTNLSSIPVTNGYFSAYLDFGSSAYDGNARYLEVGVQCPGDTNMVVLTPRQLVGAAPWAVFSSPYSSTILVHGSGTPQANGNNLISALASLQGTSNAYLIKLEPGTYDIGNSPLSLPSNVNLEGSGAGVTTVKSTDPTTGTAIKGPFTGEVSDLTLSVTQTAATTTYGLANVSAANNVNVFMTCKGAAPCYAISYTTQVRHVWVKATATNSDIYGIDGASLITDSYVQAQASVGYPTAIQNVALGLMRVSNTAVSVTQQNYAQGGAGIVVGTPLGLIGQALISNVQITTTNQGVPPLGQTLSGLDGVNVVSPSGNSGATTVMVDNTFMWGTTRNVSLYAPGTIQVSSSIMDGAPVKASQISGVVRCIGSFNNSNTALSSTCN